MAWLDPRTWFSSSETAAPPSPPVAETVPVGGPYGGRKRKNKHKTRKSKKLSTRRRRT